MRELGQLGGRARTRSVLGISDAVADDDLRGLARKQLEGLLTSENESVRLRAAASLFSYRAAQPEQDADEVPLKSLADVARSWLHGLAALSQPELEHALSREDWNAINRVGTRDPELATSFVRFTEKLAELAGRQGQPVRVEGGRVVGHGPEPPPKSVVRARPAERERVPSVEVPAPPSRAEARRAAEIKAAKADWAERDADPEPSEYTW